MALDEPKDTDEVFEFDGDIKFVMEKELLEAAKPVKVDITYTGFSVDSNLQLGGGGCGSGSCGTDSSGGCGSAGSCCS
ncbi:HesB/YadR/YfhF-family protein [Desulfovibrio ferrophilus]|uniref:HesB/YadR/YfhF-family protein n=1 Tax=Desulfovibrio ferrophilus TaxID=241368 RepID=A0A2Z6AW32_9BACT|nr:HesB/YadR/YfhF-family protein [Desulfovibrio ferrophilus]